MSELSQRFDVLEHRTGPYESLKYQGVLRLQRSEFFERRQSEEVLQHATAALPSMHRRTGLLADVVPRETLLLLLISHSARYLAHRNLAPTMPETQKLGGNAPVHHAGGLVGHGSSLLLMSFATVGAIRKVPSALVTKIFRYLARVWELSRSEQSQLLGLGADESARLDQPFASGDLGAGIDRRDRIRALLEIHRYASSLYGGNESAVRRWLRSATADLEGASPVTRMLKGMEDILLVRDYIRWLANR